MKKIIRLVGFMTTKEAEKSISKWKLSEGGTIAEIKDQFSVGDIALLVANHKIKFYLKLPYGLILSSGSIELAVNENPFERAMAYIKVFFGYEVDIKELLAKEIVPIEELIEM